MTLSKEKLAHYAMHTDGSVKAMARELLERRGRDKQEPDGWQFLGVNGLWVSVTENGMREALKEGCEVRPLYAAPQLPQPAVLSVPEGVLKSLLPDAEKPDFWFEHSGKIFFEGVKFNNAVFEACRAAMLQGAEPEQGWIPCGERMPEEIGRYWCYVEEQNSLGKSHYQWNCSWNGDRWWVESENGGRVTHWMPLPAAPQQEVK